MSVPNDYPESRMEIYLQHLCGNDEFPIPTDEIGRVELYLKYILQNGTEREQEIAAELLKKAYYYKGYKSGGNFYYDLSHTQEIPKSNIGLYIDAENSQMYYWTGSEYSPLTAMSAGKFLSYWKCDTGLADSFPETIPYTYSTGDFYIVKSVASGSGTNYRPNGSVYNAEVSSAAEQDPVGVHDYYFYDGIRWLLLKNTWPELSNYLSKSNTVAYTPTSDYHPATKKYVDDATATGGGLPEVSGSGKALVSVNGEWVTQEGYGYNSNAGYIVKKLECPYNSSFYAWCSDQDAYDLFPNSNIRVRIGNEYDAEFEFYYEEDGVKEYGNDAGDDLQIWNDEVAEDWGEGQHLRISSFQLSDDAGGEIPSAIITCYTGTPAPLDELYIPPNVATIPYVEKSLHTKHTTGSLPMELDADYQLGPSNSLMISLPSAPSGGNRFCHACFKANRVFTPNVSAQDGAPIIGTYPSTETGKTYDFMWEYTGGKWFFTWLSD